LNWNKGEQAVGLAAGYAAKAAIKSADSYVYKLNMYVNLAMKRMMYVQLL
jgi:hypothetical protein